MADLFWVDGRLGGLVPPDDRGLALADGVFETLRVDNGELVCRRLHQERLALGLGVLQFPSSEGTAKAALDAAIDCVLACQPGANGTLRLTVTRGSGPRGYAIPPDFEPRSIVRFTPGPAAASSRARLTVGNVVWSEQPSYHGCKLLTRTEQVLALANAREAGFDEVIMPDREGNWLSTGSGNLFIRRGNALVTPPIGPSGIAGTRRRAIVERWAEHLGYQMLVEPISATDAFAADEAFFCNAVIGTRGIDAIDDKVFSEHVAADRIAEFIHGDW